MALEVNNTIPTVLSIEMVADQIRVQQKEVFNLIPLMDILVVASESLTISPIYHNSKLLDYAPCSCLYPDRLYPVSKKLA